MCMITLYTPKIVIKSIMTINIKVDISLFAHFKHKEKYMINVRMPKLLPKIFCFFSLMNIRMSTKNTNFDDKTIKKSEFYKNKNVF